MPEPATSVATTAASVAGGLVAAAAIGEGLGLDPEALVWGSAGGLALMYFQPPANWWRALAGVAVAAVLAGGAAPVLTPIVAPAASSVPLDKVSHLVSLLAGLLSQVLFDALVSRVRAWGEAGKERGDAA
jgi:hypothetical protein